MKCGRQSPVPDVVCCLRKGHGGAHTGGREINVSWPNARPASITILSTPPTNLRAVRDRLSRMMAGATVTKGVSLDELEGIVNEVDRLLEYDEETR